MQGAIRGGQPISRALDVCLALAALIFLAPLLIGLAVLIKLEDGGPVFFRHRRIGLGGRPFDCLKFRTMVVDAQAQLHKLLAEDPRAREEWARNQKLRHDPRITRIGHWLRRSSLDELPQFLNVLVGSMSLVGPRPIVASEVRHYGAHFRYYCAVRPGMTGLWQVSGRTDLDYRKRVALDVAYVRARCLTLDLKILAKTIPAVLRQKGSY